MSSADAIFRDRLPPQNLDAEKSVLGSMLRANRVIGDLITVVKKDDFYTDAHQKIFQTITEHHDRGGQPVDLVILAEQLKLRGWLEDVGGYTYLASLWDAAPTAANAEYYARIVRDKALVRGLIEAGTEILTAAYNQNAPAEQLIEEAAGTVFEMASKGLGGSLSTLEEAIAATYDRIDTRMKPGGDMAHSGLNTGFTDLQELTAGLQQGELVIIAARPSVGKCLAADSEIVLADGSVVTIEEVVRRREADLLTLGDDWRLRWTTPSAFVDDGLKPTYRVTLHSGRTVETTASHPFRVLEGWKPLAELRVGDRVATPRSLPVEGREPMRECEVKLLAYLIGDGCLSDITPEFTNASPRLQADFAGAVSEFGGVCVRREESPNRTLTVRVRSDADVAREQRCAVGARLREVMKSRGTRQRELAEAVGVSASLIGLWTAGTSAPTPEMFARVCSVLAIEPDGLTVPSKTNPVKAWLDRLGLWGCKPAAKFIPALVFRLPKAQLATFLNRLFATDGWASASTQGGTQIGYATVSERLARQVQHLLLRFGILARLRKRGVLYRGTRRPSWQLEITHRDSLRTFIERIGIFGKEDGLASVAAALDRRGRKAFRDTIPEAVWDSLAVAKGDRSWASLAAEAGFSDRTNLHVGKRGLSRERLTRLARAAGDARLSELAASEVYWDRIVAIEPTGMKQVYDLTIPETHNFVANDICVHNTAFSLGLTRNVLLYEKAPVFFVSLEQSRIEIAERMLCSQAKVDSHRLRKGTLTADDMDKLIAAGNELRTSQLFIDDSPQQGMLRIAANARRLKHQKDIKLVVIDYLQLIEPENRRDPRQEQVAQISRRLKFLARELNIPVIALAQVNRASEDRQDHRPRLSDLRESGSIEQDADTVFMLHRPDRYEPGQHEGIIEVIVAKQRNGPTGEVTLAYIKQYLSYEDFKVASPFEG